jgi:Ca2+/Na+ antiporter
MEIQNVIADVVLIVSLLVTVLMGLFMYREIKEITNGKEPLSTADAVAIVMMSLLSGAVIYVGALATATAMEGPGRVFNAILAVVFILLSSVYLLKLADSALSKKRDD